jgi:hypothetical protein
MNENFNTPDPEEEPTWFERNWLWLAIAAVVVLCSCCLLASTIGLIFVPDHVESATPLPSTQTPWIITQEIPVLTATPFLPPSPIPTLVIPPTPTLVPIITPMPTATLAQCQPIAITNFADRLPSYINGIKVELQVRDLNSCARNLFYAETGIDNPNTAAIEGAQNFDLKIGDQWVWIVAPTTVAVHELNGSQIDYVNQEIVVIYGPWTGGTGVYEGAVHLVPVEWVEQILSEILPIQTAQAGHEIQIVRINQ